MATFGGASGLGSAVETGEITDGAVTNDKVNASAAIAYSKLALTGAITTTDLVVGERVSLFSKAASTIFPLPNWIYFQAAGVEAQVIVVDVNTVAHVCQMIVPFRITASVVSLAISGANTAGVLDIACYSEDGQTKHWEVATASITATGSWETTIASPVSLPAGVYYFAIVSNSTANIVTNGFALTNAANVDINTTGAAGKAVPCGVLTVTAGTLPATFDPTALTAGTEGFPIIRLDA